VLGGCDEEKPKTADQAVTLETVPRTSADGDLDVIDQLREAGSDLSRQHPVDFYLYFPGKEAAEASAARISVDGFTTVVRSGADGTSWLCLASKWMVPELAAIHEIRARFERLASSLGGEYDGWETQIQSK
jgi:hypothetical protein